MAQDVSEIRLVIITGMSGAGKTEAMRVFEDLGYFCVDNLPPSLITKFADLFLKAESRRRHLALVMDIRGGEFFDSLFGSLEQLDEAGITYQILFLEANDQALVRRYKESRRNHPLSRQGRVLDGIREERQRLQELRGRANKVIDTSGLDIKNFRQEITQTFAPEHRYVPLIVSVISFGFKHGIPLDADLVFDVRFLPNPHYVEGLRDLTGNDETVDDYVLKWAVSRKFLDKLAELIHFLLPYYAAEGKAQLAIAIGCTGGQHRSVVIANNLAEGLRNANNTVLIEHRDIPYDGVNDEEEEAPEDRPAHEGSDEEGGAEPDGDDADVGNRGVGVGVGVEGEA